MEKSKIAAVIVTFNRKQLLLECLNALRSQTYQLDAIIIIDGPSTDGTPETLLENNYINELPPAEHDIYSWNTINNFLCRVDEELLIHYIKIYEDVGGSGGFHEGVKYAYEKGYNWIWLMDDDAEPTKDALKNLIKYINLPNTLALASTVRGLDGEVSGFHRGTFSFNKYFPSMQDPLDNAIYHNNKPIKIDFASFVGLLIKSDVIKIIGYPNKNFFIHNDDVEYCLRMIKNGQIYLVPNSIVVHKEKLERSYTTRKDILGKNRHIISYAKLWKIYYGKRNLAYLGNKYSKNRAAFLTNLIVDWIKSIVIITLFNDFKIKRIHFISSAYRDGLQGIFDNEKPKRILYGRK